MIALISVILIISAWLASIFVSNTAALSLLLLWVSVIVVLKTTPFFIKRMNAQKWSMYKDMNKIGAPKVAGLGSFPIMFGFTAAVMLSIFAFSFVHFIKLDLTILFAGFTTVFLIGCIGLFDDIIGWKKGIRQYQHALLPLAAALPLMAVRIGETAMSLPLIGRVEFGILYSLVLIPVGVTGAANATNMLAGLNGLEAGIGSILAATMLVLGFWTGNIEVIILMSALIGALIAFLYFNWFPAKIFPGDAVTLMVGASIAVAAIIGNLEKFGIALLALFFIELCLKARTRFQAESFGIPQKNGTLKAPERIGSFTHLMMRSGKLNEKQVVKRILVLQAIVSLLVLSWFYLDSVQFFVKVIPWF
jgi:UDP-N-acetylglucosamine--dolichyl-phosphate N-acetylglucosaminephosphotransferase